MRVSASTCSASSGRRRKTERWMGIPLVWPCGIPCFSDSQLTRSHHHLSHIRPLCRRFILCCDESLVGTMASCPALSKSATIRNMMTCSAPKCMHLSLRLLFVLLTVRRACSVLSACSASLFLFGVLWPSGLRCPTPAHASRSSSTESPHQRGHA